MLRQFESFYVADNIEDAKEVLADKTHGKYLWVISGGISFKVKTADEAEKFFSNPVGYKGEEPTVKEQRDVAKEVAKVAAKSVLADVSRIEKPNVVTPLPAPKRRSFGTSEEVCPQCNGNKRCVTDDLKATWAREVKMFGMRRTTDTCSVCRGKGKIMVEHYE